MSNNEGTNNEGSNNEGTNNERSNNEESIKLDQYLPDKGTISGNNRHWLEVSALHWTIPTDK